MKRKKVYKNKYSFGGKPRFVIGKFQELSKFIGTLEKEADRVDVEIGIEATKRLPTFWSQKRLTILGIVIGTLGIGLTLILQGII